MKKYFIIVFWKALEVLQEHVKMDRGSFHQRQLSQESQCYSYLAEFLSSGEWSTRYIAQRELRRFQKST